MSRLRLTKILVVAAAGLALAAGTVAAIAASDGGDEPSERTAAQEETRDKNANPWLGVLARPSEAPAGLAVRHVVPESPAADAGIERGDVITAIDGQAVTEFEALRDAVQAKAAGDKVTLSVVKDGVDTPDAEAQDIEVTLEERPDRFGIKRRIGEGIGIGKLFDRFVDGQFRYLDEDGNTVTLEVTAGTVTNVSADEITIDVNGDDEGEKTFSIPDDAKVPEGLAEGDRAAVVVKDGAVQHVLPGGFPLPLPGLVPDVFPGSNGFKLPFEGGGSAMSVEVISGTVSSVNADEIVLDLGADQGEKPFSIPDGVEVPGGLEAGEQATVVVRDGEVVKIAEGGLPMDGELPFPHRFRGGPGFRFDCPCEMPEENPPLEEETAFPEA